MTRNELIDRIEQLDRHCPLGVNTAARAINIIAGWPEDLPLPTPIVQRVEAWHELVLQWVVSYSPMSGIQVTFESRQGGNIDVAIHRGAQPVERVQLLSGPGIPSAVPAWQLVEIVREAVETNNTNGGHDE